MPDVRQVKSTLRRSAKVLRVWPPLNIAATSTVRAALQLLGVPPPAFLVKHVPRVGTVRVALPNGRDLLLRSHGDDGLTGAAYWLGWRGYEPETAPVFYQLAQDSRVILDVGAHIGYYSILAALANPQSVVYAFEPLHRVHDRLRTNVRMNGLRNVSCIQAAVGDHQGTSVLYHESDGLPVTSSISASFVRALTPDGSPIAQSEVPLVPIDDFLDSHGESRPVDLVKVDVESSEASVLKGMIRTLRSHRPRIICEVLSERAARDVENILRPLGYSFALLTLAGPHQVEHLTPHPRWQNFVCTAVG